MLCYGTFPGTGKLIPYTQPYVIPIQIPPCVDWCKLNLSEVIDSNPNGVGGNSVTRIVNKPIVSPSQLSGEAQPLSDFVRSLNISGPESRYRGTGELYGTPISPPNGISSWPDIFLVQSQPVYNQSIRYVKLLEHACSWASQDNTSALMRSDLTFWTFWYGLGGGVKRIGLSYNANVSDFIMPDNVPTDWQFCLSDVLNHMDTGTVNADCLDVSTFCSLAMNSLGLPEQIRQITSSSGNFETNPICPIGSDASQAYYYTLMSWGWHSVVVTYNNDLNQSLTFDACAAQEHYYLDGSDFFNPPGADPLKLWPFAQYWSTNSSTLSLTNEPGWIYEQNGFPATDWSPQVTTQPLPKH